MKKRNFNSIRRRPVKPSKSSQPISTSNMFQRLEREGHIDVLNTAATTEKFKPKVPPPGTVIVSEGQGGIITVSEDRNTPTALENPASRSEMAALMPANEERNTTGVIDDPIVVDSHPNDSECNELMDNNPSFSIDQSEDSDIRQTEHVQAELPAASQNNEEPPRMERQDVHGSFRASQSLEIPHQAEVSEHEPYVEETRPIEQGIEDTVLSDTAVEKQKVLLEIMKDLDSVPRETRGLIISGLKTIESVEHKSFVYRMTRKYGLVKIRDKYAVIIPFYIWIKTLLNPRLKDLLIEYSNYFKDPVNDSVIKLVKANTLSDCKFAVAKYLLYLSENNHTEINIHGTLVVAFLSEQRITRGKSKGMNIKSTSMENLRNGLIFLCKLWARHKYKDHANIEERDRLIEEASKLVNQTELRNYIKVNDLDEQYQRKSDITNFDDLINDSIVYTRDELRHMMINKYNQTSEGKVRCMAALNGILEMLLGEFLLLSGSSKRLLSFRDLYLVQDDSNKPLEMRFRVSREKTNTFSDKFRYVYAMRHKDSPEVCIISAIAMNLWFKFDFDDGPLSGIQRPDFKTPEKYFTLKLQSTAYSQCYKPISPAHEISLVSECLREIGKESRAKAHLSRRNSARQQIRLGVDSDHVDLQAGWVNSTFGQRYSDGRAKEFIEAVAGFEVDHKEFIYVQRESILPPEDLQKQIFPWLEETEKEWKKYYLYEGNPEDDKFGPEFFRMLYVFRSVILQDLVFLQQKAPESIFAKHKITKDPMFLTFKRKMVESDLTGTFINKFSRPQDLRDAISSRVIEHIDDTKRLISISHAINSESNNELKNMLKHSQEQEKMLLAHIQAQGTNIKAQDIHIQALDTQLQKLTAHVQKFSKRSQKSDLKIMKMIRHIALVQNEDTSAPAVTDPVNHNQPHPMPVDGNFIAMPSGNSHGLHPHRDRPLPLPHVSHPYLDGPPPLPHGPPPDGLPTFQYGPPLPHGPSPHELPTLQYGPPRFLSPPPLPQGPKQSLPLRSKARLPIPIFSSSEEEEEEEEDEEDEEEEKEERHPPQIESNSNENPKKRKRKGGKNYICRTPPPSPPPELCNMRNDAMSVPNLVKQWYCNTDKYCPIKRREMIYRTGWRRDPNVQNIFFSRKGIINYIECVTNTLGEESKYSYRLPKNSVLVSTTLNQLSNLLEYYRMNRVGLSITRLARHCNANPEEVTKVLEEIIKYPDLKERLQFAGYNYDPLSDWEIKMTEQSVNNQQQRG